MERTVLVDGYNIIKRDESLSRLLSRSLQAAREALLGRLLSSYDLRTCDITVVFDGQGVTETAERWGRVKVIYSRSGQTADEVIARLASAARDPSQVVVLSDDRAVRQSVTQTGGQAAGSADRRPPRLVDKSGDDEEERRSREKKGNPQRAKRRRRSGTEPFRW